MDFLNAISVFFTENFGTITFSTVLALLGGGVTLYITKKVIPAFSAKLLSIVTKIVGKMFGIPSDDVSAAITQLPIVADMQRSHAEFVVLQEEKLIETKNKLVSPKLSEAERLAYQAIFDKAMAVIDYKVSVGTQKILDAIEAAAKEKSLL